MPPMPTMLNVGGDGGVAGGGTDGGGNAGGGVDGGTDGLHAAWETPSSHLFP